MGMGVMTSPVSFWLMPAEPAASRLAGVIADLADRHEAPVFAPHITLFSGSATVDSSESCHDLLAEVARGLGPFRVTPSRVDTSEDFFKTVFLRIEPAPALALLHDRLRARLGTAYAFEPHLSLIYKALPAALRQAIAHGVATPDPWLCDRLAVVASGANGWRDVAGWRLLCTYVIGAGRV
jgi:2'-5' RNA ligase